MSGGHFDYMQFRIEDIASEIDEIIGNNHIPDEYDCIYNYSDATIIKFRETALTLRKAQAMAHQIDWLVSGDDDEEEFHKRWDEENLKWSK